ncbi:glycosyltransferase [Kaarinaea lacus]
MPTPTPSLSVIIPALNEADTLPELLQDLARQKNIQLETIVVDGGSTDNTKTLCENFPHKVLISLKLISTPAGRGIQMNWGIKASSSDDYLFLHADTRINDTQLLSSAQQFMNRTRSHSPNLRVAGHFPLRFFCENCTNNYYFYESKTHLNRPDCINGDQGFWIAKDYLEWLGGFDESLPYMEDARLAQKIFETGKWITLPGEIETSARRFEAEGFTRRQILNSFLCNFNAMGVNEFFQSALDVYRTQNKTTQLHLQPFLKLAHQQMNGDGFKTALTRWYQTGGYIARNAWQLAFALDCRRNRKHGFPPGIQNATRLKFFDQYIAPLTDWAIVKALTGLLTAIWFYSLFLTR